GTGTPVRTSMLVPTTVIVRLRSIEPAKGRKIPKFIKRSLTIPFFGGGGLKWVYWKLYCWFS
ncbi:MAG: hypothetical protein V1752_02630, partial [Candidatus Firestonebacteria bacterium]